MSKYKVGQKVRVIGVKATREVCGSHDLEIGSELEIEEYDSYDNTYRLGAFNTDSWVHADDLEAVADTPEFDTSQLKRGDKIQIKPDSSSMYGTSYDGKPITFRRHDPIHDRGSEKYFTMDSETLSRGLLFKASDILGYWPEETPEYSVGDLVEVVDPKTGTYTSFKTGDIGEVTEINVGIGGKKLLVTVAGFPQLINLSQVKPFKRPKTKFKSFQVGDEVVILGTKHTKVVDRYPHKFEVGQVGKVIRIVNYADAPRGLRVECGDADWTVAHKDLHKLQPVKPVVKEPDATPKHKYAVGETLEVVSATKQWTLHLIGQKVVVKELRDDYNGTPGLNYRVEGGQVIHEDDLGPVEEPTHKYAVGDRLTVTEAGYHCFAEGTTATVVELTCAAAGCGEALTYRLDSSAGFRQRVSEEHLTPVVEKPEVTHAKPEELVLGARVRVLEENAGEIPVGTEGAIVFDPTDIVPGVLWVKEGTRGAAWVGYISHKKLQLLND